MSALFEPTGTYAQALRKHWPSILLAPVALLFSFFAFCYLCFVLPLTLLAR